MKTFTDFPDVDYSIIALITNINNNANNVSKKIGFPPNFYLSNKIFIWRFSECFDFEKFFKDITNIDWDQPENVQITILQDNKPQNFYIESTNQEIPESGDDAVNRALAENPFAYLIPVKRLEPKLENEEEVRARMVVTGPRDRIVAIVQQVLPNATDEDIRRVLKKFVSHPPTVYLTDYKYEIDEQRFRGIWKQLCKVYLKEKITYFSNFEKVCFEARTLKGKHYFLVGLARQTFAKRINEALGLNEPAWLYRHVLEVAAQRGWAKKGKTELGYTTWRLHC